MTEAKAKLSELVRRAESGEEVVLTKHGRATVQLLPAVATVSQKQRHALLARIRASAAKHARPGPAAAQSQDFLYGDSGMPE